MSSNKDNFNKVISNNKERHRSRLLSETSKK